MRWFTSDHHFAHTNILKYCSGSRPFTDVDEMNAQLIARWNQRVSPDDDVIVVGDVIASRRLPHAVGSGILQMLNGRKSLVRGNHDPVDRVFLDGGFTIVEDHMIIDGNILAVHRPCIRENGPEWGLAQRIDPLLVVHGHTHSPGPERPRHLNVCVDRWDLYPVPQSVVERRLLEAANETAEWAAGVASGGRRRTREGATMAKRTRAQEGAEGAQEVVGACSSSPVWDSTGPDPCAHDSGEDCGDSLWVEGERRTFGDPGCCGSGACHQCETTPEGQ